MKITKEEIQGARQRIIGESEQEYLQQQKDARQYVLEEMAREQYTERVFELVIHYGIDIPRDKLIMFADYFSSGGFAKHVRLAQAAYERLGMQKKAQSLEEVIYRMIDRENLLRYF